MERVGAHSIDAPTTVEAHVNVVADADPVDQTAMEPPTTVEGDVNIGPPPEPADDGTEGDAQIDDTFE
jgi:hypothetical protein